MLDLGDNLAVVLIAGTLVGAAVVAALALLFTYRPALFPIFAVAVLPFRLPVEIGDSSANLLIPLYAIIAAATVVYLGRRFAERGQNRAKRTSLVSKLLLVFVALYALQALYSPDQDKGLEQLVFFYVPFAVLFKLLVEVRWPARLAAICAAVVVVMATLFSVVGFWEFATRQLFWNSSVIDANQFAAYFRVNSVFFDPNIFGRYLTVAILIVVTVMLWGLRERWWPYYALVLAVLWGGLVVSLSQSSFAALLLGLALLAGLRWSLKWTAVTVGGTVVLGLILIAFFPGAIHLKTEKLSSLDSATSGRVELATGGVELFGDRPIWGYGAGSFSYQYREQEGVSALTAASASHNTAITVAAEQGLLGLLVYIALAISSFVMLFRRTAYRVFDRAPPQRAFNAARAAIAVSYAAIFIHSMVYAAYLEDPMTWILLGVGAALASQKSFQDGLQVT